MAEAEKKKGGIWSRRDFFTRLGWGGFGVFGGLSLLGFLRSAFPRVLFQPPASFKAGFPSDYAVGEVSEKYKEDQRVWIIREETGVYAIFAKCTHLGCTPRWLAAENKFKCPCHGSGFYKSGINFEGPAPRPLERFSSRSARTASWWSTRARFLEVRGGRSGRAVSRCILKA